MYRIVPQSVWDMVNVPGAPTAPLDDFLVAYEEDDNWWWIIKCGHHQNLFEAVVDRLSTATQE